MKIYLDGMLVKSQKIRSHIVNMKKALDVLRKFQLKLNPKKYAFGVKSGKFLEYMVIEKRIEVNPEKVKAI